MGFQTDKYSETRWERRTFDFEIKNPELIKFFDKKDKKVWVLQSLTGTEVGLAEQASANRKLATELMEALMQGRKEDLVSEIKKITGASDEIPELVVRKFHQFMFGLKSPKGSLDFSIELCRQHPTEFFAASIKIMEISNLGMSPGKLQPSGQMKK
jgi:hypothetical protein